MKQLSLVLILLLVFNTYLVFPKGQQQKSLQEIYKTGKVQFVEKLRISNDNLPEGVVLQFFGDLFEDKNGNIFLLDNDSNHILKLNAKGKLLKVIGRKGQGPGDFYIPRCMVHDDQHIFVYEFGNKRFSLLDIKGDFIKVIKSNGVANIGLITKMKYSPDDNFIIGHIKFPREKDFQEMSLQIYSKDFKLEKTILSGQIFMFKRIGNTKIHHPYFRQYYWDMGTDGKIVFGFSGKSEFTIYDPKTGKTDVVRYKYKKSKITEEVKEEYLKQFSYDGGKYGEVPDYIRKYTVFPKYKPAFNNIIFDSQNNILVFPEDKSSFFYAFDPSGKFLNKVEISSGVVNTVKIFPVKNGYFWFYKVDREYNIYIIKYKMQSYIK